MSTAVERPDVKLKLILVAATVGAVLALPSLASAAAPQDSVTLSGGPATASNEFTIFDLSAASGPSGEDPTGHVKIDVAISFPDVFTLHLEGPVTCLAVDGSQASINFIDPDLSALGVLRIQVVDGQPDTADLFAVTTPADDCSPVSRPPSANLRVTNGDITVVDAQALPTTAQQCKRGGWRQFGFENLGRCVAFVVRTKVCAALERRGIHLKICPPTPPRQD